MGHLSLGIQGQPGQHSEAVFQKDKGLRTRKGGREGEERWGKVTSPQGRLRMRKAMLKHNSLVLSSSAHTDTHTHTFAQGTVITLQVYASTSQAVAEKWVLGSE